MCEHNLKLAHTQTYLSLKLFHNVPEQVLIEVLAPQEGVAIGGLDLKDTLLDLQH